MNARELINHLQKFDPELEIFIDSFMGIKHIDHIRKIKVMKDKEKHIISGVGPIKFEMFELDRFNKKAMNTKYPQAILLSDRPKHMKK